MFFVWTSEGGPLQYVGLGLFLLQMIPRMFPDLTTLGLLAMVAPSAIILATLQTWQSGGLETALAEFAQWRNRLRTRLTDTFGVECTSMGLSALLSMMVGAFVAFLFLLDAYWLSALSQLFALGVVVYTHFYGPAAMIGQHRRRQGHPHVETPAERASRHAKMSSIAELVQAMPVENFVPEERVHEDCSISQLKDMLKRRGLTQDELESFVDRQNLEETLAQRRKYSDTCCICFEPFEAGEPLRILSNCQHELHMECLDKWAFTFASAIKRQHDPSCPLCKVTL